MFSNFVSFARHVRALMKSYTQQRKRSFPYFETRIGCPNAIPAGSLPNFLLLPLLVSARISMTQQGVRNGLIPIRSQPNRELENQRTHHPSMHRTAIFVGHNPSEPVEVSS